MRAGLDQPLGVLLPARGGDAAEPGADAADRRAVPGNTLVWVAPDGASSSARGLYGRAQAGAAADGEDGSGADLPAPAHHGSASGASGLPISAAGSGDRAAEPGLVCRPDLH